MDYDAFKSRYAVDQEGLILYYSEMNLNSGIEHKFEIDVEKKELSSEIFLPASDYAVFDEEGFRNLYLEGQKDELKHKQWSEFMQLFGSK